MQLRFNTGLTSAEYISRQAWREATLERCPAHPGGGCGFARHTSYPRVSPPGARVARWYCRKAHETFSLLPDCLAARLPGTLAEVEAVVCVVEQASSLEEAVARLRPEVGLVGVLRWTRRRVRAVHSSLNVLRGLLPEPFASCPATLSAFAERLGVEAVLPALRAIAADFLHQLPAPLGLRPRALAGGEARLTLQHEVGPDPPGSAR